MQKTFDLKQPLVKILSRYALPLLLAAVVMNIIFKTYMGDDVRIYNLGFGVYECLLFALFEWLKPKKVIRGLVYTALTVCILFFSMNLLRSGFASSGKTFIDWFYLNSQEVGRIYDYFYFLFIGLGFFIASVLYYFTIVRYRSFGTMLVLLFPFFIYGKRADSMATFDITLMLTVFLALMVHSRLVSDDSNSRLIINKSYAAAAAIFVTIVGAIAMFVPLPSHTSYLENNKNFFDLQIQTRSDYADLSEQSSPRFGADTTGEILFNFTTTSDEQVIYLRRQSFDNFVGERWVTDYNYYDSSFDFDKTVHLYGDNEVNSTSYTYDIMKKLAASGQYEYFGFMGNEFPDDLFSQKAVMNQYSDSFTPSYIPAPLLITPGESTVYFKTVHGEVYRPYDAGNTRLGISFEYYPETEKEREFAKNLKNVYAQSFEALINDAKTNGSDAITDKQIDNLQKLYELYTDVSDYDDTDRRMAQLAEDITKDCKNDYETAEALVNYFEQNGYVYDNEYEPSDESIAYFLFTSKRGNCTSYATSMTLMARMLGLPARYVEGFAAYEKNENGEFVVRDSHAHAFVEVFVAGVGWMTFDPTVAGYQQDLSGQGGGFDVSTFVSWFSRIALVIAVIFVLIFFVMLDRIMELFFRISLKFSSNVNRVLRLYRRVIRLLEISSRDSLSGYTPEMIGGYVSQRGGDIGRLIELFQRVCFGGYEPTAEDWAAVYSQYKSQWKVLAKKQKMKMVIDEDR
ncbi:transglutaminaseTgpA domain-containing protein [Ruminococcus sp.]|uniref:transglutaminase TgpA family protein n=1 Tax=Ruminococcus sp. TaxID=41978 RepID=UPI0025F455E4|nr:transglutaminaseTgpA domain-containing protein [Ruminococcus sp.]